MIGLTFIRSLHNITMEFLAQNLETTKQNVSLWENDSKRKIPNKYLSKLSYFFDLPEEYFQKELTTEEEIIIEKKKMYSEIRANYNINCDEIKDFSDLYLNYKEEFSELAKAIQSGEEAFKGFFKENRDVVLLYKNLRENESKILLKEITEKIETLFKQDNSGSKVLRYVYTINLLSSTLDLLSVDSDDEFKKLLISLFFEGEEQ